jgi:CheY-like chemotaxis protein
MSYPAKIHALIIEDEKELRDEYRETFADLAKKHPVCAQPTIATCHEEACEKIAEEAIYHLVILDLGLPYKRRLPAEDGAEPGQDLIRRLATRERYPVPSLLVLSGRLALTQQSDLLDALRKDFFYGRAVQKGTDNAREISLAVEAVERYCRAGVHVWDPGESFVGNAWFPAISPREEDLLRRCILQGGHLGVDLSGWSAERGRSSLPESYDNGPTKVFMGRFLLDRGQERSRPTFFKFEPAGNATFTFQNAAIMDAKLRHVKVCYTGIQSHRSLLVTQSVSDGTPIPLDKYLAGPDCGQAALASLANDAWTQLSALGTTEDEELRVSDAFWGPLCSSESRASIVKALEDYGGRSPLPPGPSPIEVFDAVRRSTASVWATFRSGTHGDLNASNVAIGDESGSTRAWIFDAGCIERDLAVRDLAYLEATTLLFGAPLPSGETEAACNELYARGRDFIEISVDALGAGLGRNVVQFIVVLRRLAAAAVEPRLYALLVFNASLCQLFGLAVAPSRNKIRDPGFAVEHARRVAHWLVAVAPDWTS